MEELLFYLFFKASETRFRSWQDDADEDELVTVLTNAVSKLKEMDQALKARGYIHLIYISPTRKQVLHLDERDGLVRQLLEKAGLKVTLSGR